MNEPKDKLVQAFNHMVDELHAAIEKTEETLSPTIDEIIKRAESTSRKLYALSQDEAHSISEQVKREVSRAREYMQTEGRDLRQWLNFDIKLVEDRFVDFLTRAADKNWLDFHAFNNQQENFLYHTGEVCGAGTLRCVDCGQTMQFKRNTRIPPCPKCHHSEFERVQGQGRAAGSD